MKPIAYLKQLDKYSDVYFHTQTIELTPKHVF